jgi:hypothetical protein
MPSKQRTQHRLADAPPPPSTNRKAPTAAAAAAKQREALLLLLLLLSNGRELELAKDAKGGASTHTPRAPGLAAACVRPAAGRRAQMLPAGQSFVRSLPAACSPLRTNPLRAARLGRHGGET